MSAFKPLGRAGMAARLARDIPDGWYVNLGIGIPTLATDHVPDGREVVFHSENGILGMGSAAAEGRENKWLINASSQYVTLREGAAYVHHADSFGIVRGGHLDLCVLGAYQVGANGDLANWARSADDHGPQIGGAMDLAFGAKQIWVVMEHTTKGGEPRLVERCSYPLTAPGVVRRVYTNLAVIEVTGGGFMVREMVPGLSFAELQARTGAPLHAAPDLKGE